MTIEQGRAHIEATMFLGSSFAGIVVQRGGSLILYDIIVRDKGSVGVNIRTMASSLPSEIVNCTFYRNGLGALNPDGAIRVFISESDGPRVTIKNTIVARSLVGVGVDLAEGVPGAVVDVSYSALSENTTTYEGPVQQQEGVIFLSPEFRSTEDLHLQETSPAMDSGSPHTGITRDLDGVARPSGLGWDMGAYEVGCGNGITELDEECDDGENGSDTDSCKAGCIQAICGDGIVRIGVEACDDGNRNDRDGCGNECGLPSCGNGVPDPGEECDDGNVSNMDSCLASCLTAFCGDGFINVDGEECDDGDNVDGDDCSNECVARVTTPATTGGGCAATGSIVGCAQARTALVCVALLIALRRRRSYRP
jgi:cysteine-rich repeat protein